MDRENLSLYILYQGDKPIAYRYGEEWRAMQLMMDGGYKTPLTAWLAWVVGEETHERQRKTYRAD